jgi:hypothetical protein
MLCRASIPLAWEKIKALLSSLMTQISNKTSNAIQIFVSTLLVKSNANSV